MYEKKKVGADDAISTLFRLARIKSELPKTKTELPGGAVPQTPALPGGAQNQADFHPMSTNTSAVDIDYIGNPATMATVVTSPPLPHTPTVPTDSTLIDSVTKQRKSGPVAV